MIPPPSKEYLASLAAFEPRIADLAVALRAIVVEEAPEAYELIYDALNAVAAGFTFTGQPNDSFIHIVAYSGWVNLGFNKGSELTDPARILRGEGQSIRHIRISSLADIERTFVRKYVQDAVAQAKKVPSKLKRETVVPTISAKKRSITGGVRRNRGTDSKPT